MARGPDRSGRDQSPKSLSENGCPSTDFYALVQSIVAMLVITAPPDPAKTLLFNSIVGESGMSRTAAATRVAVIVGVILGGSALGGAQLAKLLRIHLNAFSVVAGTAVAGMGFEMLYGGKVSKTQGQEHTQHGPEEADGLVMPLSIPLIAGPGAIVTCVSISSSPDQDMLAALIAALSVALACFISFQWFGEILSRVSARTTALLLRIGGMLLATIGSQMLLGGLKKFFEL